MSPLNLTAAPCPVRPGLLARPQATYNYVITFVSAGETGPGVERHDGPSGANPTTPGTLQNVRITANGQGYWNIGDQITAVVTFVTPGKPPLVRCPTISTSMTFGYGGR